MEARVRDIAGRVAKPPTISDEEIIAMLTQEAKKRRELVAERGVLAFMEPLPKKGEINKTFLKNTIQSVESHNRREEEADCWREHNLQKTLRVRDRPTSEHVRKRPRTESRRRSHQQQGPPRHQIEERSKWAQQKAMTMMGREQSTTVDMNGNIITSDTVSSNQEEGIFTSSNEDDRAKKHKAKKVKRDKKHKKKHKAKHKHKDSTP